MIIARLAAEGRADDAVIALVSLADIAPSIAGDGIVTLVALHRIIAQSAVDAAQWIKNTDPIGGGTTDHVYGRLRRNVVNITGRATYAFSRDMTLEAFLQPFVAVGNYSSIRKLARPSSFEFTPVTLDDNPDFNLKSLRSTVVLRWEYVRGSTFFFIWNLSTSDTSRPGVFSPTRDLGSAFRAPGTNVFAVKINYWLTP